MTVYKKIRQATLMALVVVASIFSMGADVNPNDLLKTVMTWRKPETYPVKMLDGMDVQTLSVMLDSGNLQWYEPRPQKDSWDGVVGLKVHAPHQAVWDVITNYELLCKIMSDTFDTCKVIERKGNDVKVHYKLHTSVVRFSYKFEDTDKIKEEPPYNIHIDTIEGGLKGRHLDLLLVPVEDGKTTLLFMRYYPGLRSLGGEMVLALKLLPIAEPPVAVSVANYHCRSYRNEVERRIGYKSADRSKNLDIATLDEKTLRLINKLNGGLMRETPQGKVIDALAFSFFNAPPEIVWQVATDFENYPKFFTGYESKIESRTENTVLLRQKLKAVELMGFKLGVDLHSKYTLEPPYHISYVSIDGPNVGTTGDIRIKPLENGTKSLLFATAGINLDNDKSLVASVAKSGAFPMTNVLNLLSAQTSLAFLRKEAERRAGK